MHIDVKKVTVKNYEEIVPLIAHFRSELLLLNNIHMDEDLPAARREAEEYLDKDMPVYMLSAAGQTYGYLVCRIEDACVWAEQIYVLPEYRRKGLASLLFAQAEKLAAASGEPTVYCNVHPNNHAIIQFLKSRGYTYLNLIEIRRGYPGEQAMSKIRIGDHDFDY